MDVQGGHNLRQKVNLTSCIIGKMQDILEMKMFWRFVQSISTLIRRISKKNEGLY